LSYLFVLCADGLTNFLKFEENVGNLLGVKVCRGAPVVSHIPFLWETSSVSELGFGGTRAIIRDDRGFFLAGEAAAASHSYLIGRGKSSSQRSTFCGPGGVECNMIEVNSDCVDMTDVMKNGGNCLGSVAAIYEKCILLYRN
jgi:hypothetical protein